MKQALDTSPYLTTLTPLRGIAALLVVVFHCNIMFKPWLPEGYTNFVMSAWLWVDFFFILSGFIMTYVYGKYFAEKCRWPDYKKFIGARFARVYPLYFVIMICAGIIGFFIVHMANGLPPFLMEVFNPKSLPECLVFIQSLRNYSITPLNPPAWSISAEWWVYMIFPFFVPLFARSTKIGKGLLLLFILGFFIFLRYVIGPIAKTFPGGQPTLNMSSDWGWLRSIAGFLLGMFAFEIYKNKTGLGFFNKSWAFALFFIGAIACMQFGAMDMIIVFIFPLIIITAAHNKGVVKKILDTKVLQRLGDWSFSIYMVHAPIMFCFFVHDIYLDPNLPMKPDTAPPDYKIGALYCLIIVILTIIVASITYRFIELPARNYLNKRFDTKSKKIEPASLNV